MKITLESVPGTLRYLGGEKGGVGDYILFILFIGKIFLHSLSINDIILNDTLFQYVFFFVCYQNPARYFRSPFG